MSREAFETFYMTLDESNRSDLYRTTKPFRGVKIGDYKWIVTRSMYIGWQAAEINQPIAELIKTDQNNHVVFAPFVCPLREGFFLPGVWWQTRTV